MVRQPSYKDIARNYHWLYRIVWWSPHKVPSAFFVADAFLQLDKRLGGSLLKPQSREEDKLRLAGREALKVKRLVGALRALWRSSAYSHDERIAQLKALIQASPQRKRPEVAPPLPEPPQHHDNEEQDEGEQGPSNEEMQAFSPDGEPIQDEQEAMDEEQQGNEDGEEQEGNHDEEEQQGNDDGEEQQGNDDGGEQEGNDDGEEQENNDDGEEEEGNDDGEEQNGKDDDGGEEEEEEDMEEDLEMKGLEEPCDDECIEEKEHSDAEPAPEHTQDDDAPQTPIDVSSSQETDARTLRLDPQPRPRSPSSEVDTRDSQVSSGWLGKAYIEGNRQDPRLIPTSL
eukprot:Skav231828  [mRNA]  locus=scaffold7912:2348:3493:- [translate_table: standard]